MIIVQLSGGLGNQLFQYAAGYSLSQKNRTTLWLDTSLFGSKGESRTFSLDKFQIELKQINLSLLKLVRSEKTKVLTAHRWVNVFHKTVCDPVWKEVPFSAAERRIYLKGYWVFPNYFLDQLPFLRKHIQLKEPYRTKPYNEVRQLMKGKNCVAVHVRRGDYLSAGYNEIFFALPPSYFEASMQKMEEQIADPVFIVFSDDVPWTKENIRFPVNSFFAADFGVSEDYLEFDLMRQCSHQIISNSTFSWWAALLNRNEAKTVIQPVAWYKNPDAQKVYESGKIFRINGGVHL